MVNSRKKNQLKLFRNGKDIRDDYFMNDGVELTSLEINLKQHKLKHIAGGVIVDHIKRTAVVIGDHHVLKSDQIERDLKKN